MTTHDAVIVGSHVMLPSGMADVSIVIDGGVITRVTAGAAPAADRRIDATGLVSDPGIIDPHVHYGFYSPIYTAARTESHAAAIGGVTTMMRMLRLPDPFEVSLPEQLAAMSRHHHVDYAVHASVFTPEQVRGMPFCVRNGVSSFKIYMNLGGEVGHVYMDMRPGSDGLVPSQVNVGNDLVLDVVRGAARLDCPVLVHAEDYEMCGCGMRDAQERHLDGLPAWSESRPPESEARAIRTVSGFGREHGCTIYFVHVGSAAALEQIRRERDDPGTDIFVETCPHYLLLSYEAQRGYLAKVMPPIRTNADRDAVWGAVRGGMVDAIGTAHVANRLGVKLGGGGNVWGALAGFPGIGTLVPIMLHEGVNSGRITLEEFVRMTSSNAAGIFGLSGKGRIAAGCDADIVMLDLKRERRVTPDLFGGFSDYTVYDGIKLRGWPVRTMVRGEVVSDEFEVTGKPGHGAMARRDRAQPGRGGRRRTVTP